MSLKAISNKAFFSLPLKLRVQLYFFFRHKYFLNLNTPKTFSEKINHRKLNPEPIFSLLADKHRVRDYVTDKIGSSFLIPLVCVLDKNELHRLPSLKGNFVAKTTHGSGPDNLEFLPSRLAPNLLVEKFELALKQEFRGLKFGELHYGSIPRKVVVENRIGGERAPIDYKFHIFENDGDIRWFLQVDAGRFSNHIRNYYDSSLNKIDLSILHPNGDIELPEAKHIFKMADLASTLVQGLSYARIDFYLCAEQIYFGEITLTPGSGFEKFSDKRFDTLWGNLWK